MWGTIANYVREHRVRYIFGCGSLYTTEVSEASKYFAMLRKKYYAPDTYRVFPMPAKVFPGVDPELHSAAGKPARFQRLPSLLKGYLRVGAWICGRRRLITSSARRIFSCCSISSKSRGLSNALGSSAGRVKMRWLKVSALLSLWALFFALVVVTHVWISILALPNRWKIVSRLMRSFALILRSVLNIKVSIVGNEGQLERGGYVIISNHMSYVDGIILGSIFPIVFVSKREVKSWPIIGQWNTLCGTVYINRQKKGLVAGLVREMTVKLSQQANILVFPEGTSTNGNQLLPFQTVPLAAPLRNRAIIVPVTLVYTRIEDEPVSARTRDLVYWYGDMEFMPHFWKLLSLGSMEALVTIQSQIECFRYEDNSAGRKKLARDCYNCVLGRQTNGDSPQDSDGKSRADNSDAALSS